MRIAMEQLPLLGLGVEHLEKAERPHVDAALSFTGIARCLCVVSRRSHAEPLIFQQYEARSRRHAGPRSRQPCRLRVDDGVAREVEIEGQVYPATNGSPAGMMSCT